MSNNKIILLLTTCFILKYVYLLCNQNTIINPFPLYRQQSVYLSQYIDYASERLVYIILIYIVTQCAQNKIIDKFFWLFVGYFVDYFFTFNQPFFYKISYSMIAGVIMIVSSYKQFLKHA